MDPGDDDVAKRLNANSGISYVKYKIFALAIKVLKMARGEFEDIKGVIKIRISKKDRLHNGQKKKDKRINNDLQKIHIKLKIE